MHGGGPTPGTCACACAAQRARRLAQGGTPPSPAARPHALAQRNAAALVMHRCASAADTCAPNQTPVFPRGSRPQERWPDSAMLTHSAWRGSRSRCTARAAAGRPQTLWAAAAAAGTRTGCTARRGQPAAGGGGEAHVGWALGASCSRGMLLTLTVPACAAAAQGRPARHSLQHDPLKRMVHSLQPSPPLPSAPCDKARPNTHLRRAVHAWHARRRVPAGLAVAGVAGRRVALAAGAAPVGAVAGGVKGGLVERRQRLHAAQLRHGGVGVRRGGAGGGRPVGVAV